MYTILLFSQGRIAVYRWPHPDNLPCKTRSGRNAVNGLCDDYPPPELIRLLVRLYVVKGKGVSWRSYACETAIWIDSLCRYQFAA